MKNKIKIHRRFYVIIMLGILLCGMCLAGADMTVKAEENNFGIWASARQTDKDAYDVQLTFENLGADWEGTARLFLHETYTEEGDAYDTALSLPQGSTKQFVVKVPVDSITTNTMNGKVILLDKKGRKAAEKEFSQIFREEVNALSMGILSDTYAALTYLDMGGLEMDYYSLTTNSVYSTYPIKLMELDQDNLMESLDTLNFLVIDNYNTSILADEALSGIESWVNDGGVLIVGTGGYAEDTLSGLDYLDVQCDKVYAPGEGTFSGYGVMDVSLLSMAELTDGGKYYTEDKYVTLCWMSAQGDGAVGILPYSLSELGSLKSSAYDYSGYAQEDFVHELLDNVSSRAAARYNNGNTYSYSSNSVRSNFRRMLSFFGSGANRLRYGGLKFIVVIYVIFAGPILYLILRALKKRDLYWVALPAAAFAGVILIYFAGRGFEVVSTRVYSVTIENLSSAEKARTYLHCYDANHREWDLQLAEEYEYAGPLAQTRYNYDAIDEYYYRIQKEGDRLAVGINPSSSFEDSYFLADKAKESGNASISANVTRSNRWDVQGTVMNGTDWDFEYFIVIVDDSLFLFEDLKAGESCNVEDKEQIYSVSSNTADRYFYSCLGDLDDLKRKEDADILTALGIGLYRAYPESDSNAVIVIGVTKNWSKAVDDNCSEVSYGCLYAVQ